MVLNLGLSGQPFCGPDIGGFVGDTDPELFARWMGIGALMPFCRSHKDKGTKDHEPWALTEDVERVCRLGLERRYRLLPYLYTVFEEAVRTGLPIVRPLFFAEPFDPRLRTVDDAFLLGRDILVVSPGLRMFDPGSHPAFQRWKPFELTAEHPLLPRCYLRPGSVLPVGPVMQHTGERPTDPLTLYVNLDQSGQAEGRLYEDDGESLSYARGEYRVTSFSVIAAGTGVSVTSTFQFNGFEPAARRIETVLL